MKQAGLDSDGLSNTELFKELVCVQDNLAEGEEVKGSFPYYGFLTIQTMDSELWQLNVQDLLQIYAFQCRMRGAIINTDILFMCDKTDLLKELQLIRGLRAEQKDYLFDLMVEKIVDGSISFNDADGTKLYKNIYNVLKHGEIWIPPTKYDNSKKESLKAVETRDVEHIMGLTSDHEIYHMSLDDALEELKYQNDLMHCHIEEEEMKKFSHYQIVAKLLDLRDRHTKIYNAMNLKQNEEEEDHGIFDADAIVSDSTDVEDDESDVGGDMETTSDPADLMDTQSSKTMSEDDEDESTETDVSMTDEMSLDPNEAPNQVNTITQSPVKQNNRQIHTVPNDKLQIITPDKWELVSSKKKKKVRIQINQDNTQSKANTSPSTELKSTAQQLQMEGEGSSKKQTSNNIFYARVALSPKSSSPHVPSIVTKFLKVLFSADVSFQVLPFDTDIPIDDSTIITHPNQLPHEEQDFAQWIAGVMVNRTQQLMFSLRVSSSMTFRELKGTMDSWCKKNGCWLTFDHIQAPSIIRIGWIKGIHPRCHDRRRLQQFLIQ